MRKPLMAGNWKMNLNHLEAIAVAQKLVYSLDDKDYDAVDVAILPPFTDIRSIQTLVDGDRLRHGISKDLGFSAKDRAENVRRGSEVARILLDAGLIVLVALVSPYEVDRQRAKEMFPDSDFHLVWKECCFLNKSFPLKMRVVPL